MPLDPVLVVFIAALITAIATGLGAVPFAFVPNYGRRSRPRPRLTKARL